MRGTGLGMTARITGWAFTLLLVGCASAPTVPQVAVREGQTFDLGAYIVSAPPGTGWTVEEDKEAKGVQLLRRKVSSRGEVTGVTVVQVRPNQVLGETALLDEEREADRFRDHEETGMVEFGVKTGQYKLFDVRRESETIEGVRYHLIAYRQAVPERPGRAGQVIDAVLYLYYPPDFKDRRVFYMFFIGDSTITKYAINNDTRQIEPVLRSFRPK